MWQSFTANANVFSSLQQLVPASHILLGTDYSFAPASELASTLQGINTYSGLSEQIGRISWARIRFSFFEATTFAVNPLRRIQPHSHRARHNLIHKAIVAIQPLHRYLHFSSRSSIRHTPDNKEEARMLCAVLSENGRINGCC